jgi:hypothetical protein
MPLTDPVPSTALDVLQRNCQDVDKFANQDSGTFQNRTGDVLTPLPVFNQQIIDKIASIGFTAIEGATFETGATVPDGRSLLLWSAADGGTGFYYYFSGVIPSGGKIVPPDSTPASTGGTGAGGWLVIDDLEARLAGVSSAVSIAGVTAAQVAEAADIAIGNFVTPERYFTGDTENTNADWLSACVAALATGRRVLLSRIYGLSAQLNIPANGKVSGRSRNTTGFKRVGASAGGAVIAFNGNNVTLSCFRVDAMNIGSAPSNRLNAVSVNSPAKDFNIMQVDVFNATGYGHVTFGTEANADVSGRYYDCRSENCQVLFEQIGAADVTLISCIGVGTEGRTTDMFHPYAGSRRVTYIDCHASGVSSAGISATTTSGFGLGPFTFINSSIDIVGGGSAVVSSTVSGAQANTEIYFHGGRYKTSVGQSATISNRVIFKAFGTRFEGPGGFNCPAVPANEVIIELVGCQTIASLDSAGAQTNAIITNGSFPKIIGGSVEAYNNLAGGKVAVLGNALISRETDLIPTSTARPFRFIAETAGTIALTVDGATTGFAVVNLPAVAARDKLVVTATISRSTDTYSSNFDTLTWSVTNSDSSITFRYAGNDTTNLRVHYTISVLP